MTQFKKELEIFDKGILQTQKDIELLHQLEGFLSISSEVKRICIAEILQEEFETLEIIEIADGDIINKPLH